MQIIRKSRRVHVESYALEFENNDAPGGYSFACDKRGNVIEGLGILAQDNLNACLSGEYDVTPLGVKDYSYDYLEHAIGKCYSCGREVELIAFTNTCECGLEYNQGGQLLAPRSQWEEDY